MKKITIVFLCIFISITLLSCATVQNNSNKEQKDAVYTEIQNEIDKLIPFECRDFLANYLAGLTYVEAKYRDKRGVNWGTLVIRSPINASANLHIKTYRYRRRLSDPREIYYLLNYMQSFVQFETNKNHKTTINTKVGGGLRLEQTVNVTYDVSDSIAYSFIKVWISESMEDGVRGINVDDATNGIIAGRSQLTRNDYWQNITYRVYIRNGVATLHIVSLEVRGIFIGNSQEEVNATANNICDRILNRLINSFQRIF